MRPHVSISGDVIGVAGNHWDGFNKGRNHRTNRIGLYPEYKTEEQVRIVDFPTYPQVTETRNLWSDLREKNSSNEAGLKKHGSAQTEL